VPKRYSKREMRALLAAAELPALHADRDFDARVLSEHGEAVATFHGGKERFARAELFAAAPAMLRQLLKKPSERVKKNKAKRNRKAVA
jgi:hypothetical protein